VPALINGKTIRTPERAREMYSNATESSSPRPLWMLRFTSDVLRG